ncbi:hypothetical protein KSD_80610 [Ktedonobacter sp. SOSP1-85]|nr:response regulator [Ktedonobacter sp. SOSP1-85]GHO80290.1 hypothetical protein KSD_80610 [Ktedonobacter sp. SOSP1-85]
MHHLSMVEKQAKMQAATTILVIEDDLHVGYMLAQALKEEFSCKVIFATDALQALKMIRLVLPDLILLDYHLPQMDGLAFLAQMNVACLKPSPLLALCICPFLIMCITSYPYNVR